MPIYAVVKLGKASERDAVFEEKLGPLDVYSGEAPNIWFVNYPGTSYELSDALGIGSDTEKKRGIVISVGTGYYGFGGRDMWEWLSIRERT